MTFVGISIGSNPTPGKGVPPACRTIFWAPRHLKLVNPLGEKRNKEKKHPQRQLFVLPAKLYAAVPALKCSPGLASPVQRCRGEPKGCQGTMEFRNYLIIKTSFLKKEPCQACLEQRWRQISVDSWCTSSSLLLDENSANNSSLQNSWTLLCSPPWCNAKLPITRLGLDLKHFNRMRVSERYSDCNHLT